MKFRVSVLDEPLLEFGSGGRGVARVWRAAPQAVNRHAKGTPYRRPKRTPSWRLVPVVHRGDPRGAECPSRS